MWLLDVECLPFTLNRHYLADYKAKFLAYYQESRKDPTRRELVKNIENWRNGETTVEVTARNAEGKRVTYEQPTPLQQALNAFAQMGQVVKPEQFFAMMLPDDEMAPAINIMADVRAYFQGDPLSDF